MKAIGYVRISTQGQEDKYGVDSQKQMITEHCEKNDIELVDIIIDIISGVKENRDKFDNILYTNDYDFVDCVVVAKTDRIARDMNLFFFYKMLLGKKNIEIASVIDDFSQFGDFANILQAFIVFVAEQERKNITIRTTNGRNTKFKKTKNYCGGRLPYGYKHENNNFALNENEIDIVKNVIRLKKLKFSYRYIKSYLEENGFKTRSEKLDWSVSTIKSICDNERFYKGYYSYGENEEVIGDYPLIGI